MTVCFHLNALQHILRTGIQIPKFYTYILLKKAHIGSHKYTGGIHMIKN
jgi:hypothetical protein